MFLRNTYQQEGEYEADETWEDKYATIDFIKDFNRLFELLIETNFSLCCSGEDGKPTKEEELLTLQFYKCSKYDDILFGDDYGKDLSHEQSTFVEHIRAIADVIEQHIKILDKQIGLHESLMHQISSILNIRNENINGLGKVINKVRECEEKAKKGKRNSAITGIAAGISFFLFPPAAPVLAVASAAESITNSLIESMTKDSEFKNANKLFVKDRIAMQELQQHSLNFQSQTQENHENLREMHKLIATKFGGASSGSANVFVPNVIGIGVTISAIGVITALTARTLAFQVAKSAGGAASKSIGKELGKGVGKEVGKSVGKAAGKAVAAVAVAAFLVFDIMELIECSKNEISEALRKLIEQLSFISKNKDIIVSDEKKHQKIIAVLQNSREKLKEFLDVLNGLIHNGTVRSVNSLKGYMQALCSLGKAFAKVKIKDRKHSHSDSSESSSEEEEEDDFNVATFNLHSMNVSKPDRFDAKCEYIKSLILKYQLDVLLLNETWLNKGNENEALQSCLPNSNLFYVSEVFPSDRPKRGLAIIYNSNRLEAAGKWRYGFDSVDGLTLNFRSTHNEKIAFQGTSVYCDPNRPKVITLKGLLELYMTNFAQEISFALLSQTIKSLLGKSKFSYKPQEMVVGGDFNIALNHEDDPYVKAYVAMNKSFNIKIHPSRQQTPNGTHRGKRPRSGMHVMQRVGNILDHINTRVKRLGQVVVDEEPALTGISDHFLVKGQITVQEK